MWNPRVGGEKILEPSMGVGNFGSPPHGRGKVKHVLHAVLDVGITPRGRGKEVGPLPLLGGTRITPAWAGKSSGQHNASLVNKDHPRVGGEKQWSAQCQSRQ